MENEKYLKMNFTQKYLINDFDFDTNKHDLNTLSLLPILKDEYLKDNILSKDENDFFESDEYDYDSDCSLGSMNSLYLYLKDGRTFQNSSGNEKQLLHRRNNNFNIANDTTMNNLMTRKHVLEVKKFNGNLKDTKSVEKLNTLFFYGKQFLVPTMNLSIRDPILNNPIIPQYEFFQKSATQHIYTKQSYGCRRKNIHMNSKTIKTTYTISKFKHKINKLSISLKNRKHRKHSIVQKIVDNSKIIKKNESLLRYKLKEQIPLLQLRGKIKIQISQKNETYSNILKTFRENQKDYITDRKIINDEGCTLEYRYIENQVSDSKFFYIDDFMEPDDFSDTKVIEDIIKKLFDDDDSNTNNNAINTIKYVDFNYYSK